MSKATQDKDRATRALVNDIKRQDRCFKFKEKYRDWDETNDRRERLGMRDRGVLSTAESRAEARDAIAGSKDLVVSISRYTTNARDRTNLSTALRKTNPDPDPQNPGALLPPWHAREDLCLPEKTGDGVDDVNIFRTNPDPDPEKGCGPFLERSPRGTCCHQQDLDLCAKVAAIVHKDSFMFGHRFRVENEIHKWMMTTNRQLVDDIEPIVVIAINLSILKMTRSTHHEV
ncbi:unnamed protein product [Pylaiella littoralis]